MALHLSMNEIDSIIATYTDKQQDPVRYVSAESGLNVYEVATKGNKRGQTFKVAGDPTKAVHYEQRPDLSTAVYGMPLEIMERIKYVSGVNDFYGGQQAGSVQTKGGIDTMVNRATLRDNIQMQNIEWFMKDLTELI
jgi:hypothetical protein